MKLNPVALELWLFTTGIFYLTMHNWVLGLVIGTGISLLGDILSIKK